MSCRFLVRVAASIAAVTSISLGTIEAHAGGCGCEAPSQTVYHVHQRCHGHCHRGYPPMGMVVPSAPMMAAPMMMAPMMAAPVMQAPIMQAPVMQAPVMQAPMMSIAAAPTVSFAPTQTFQLAPQTCGGAQGALQLSLVQQPQGALNTTITHDQLRALLNGASDSQSKGTSAALRGLGGSLEDRVKALEDRVDALQTKTDALHEGTLEIIKAVKELQTKAGN